MLPQSRLTAHGALHHPYLAVSHDSDLLFDEEERGSYIGVVNALDPDNSIAERLQEQLRRNGDDGCVIF